METAPVKVYKTSANIYKRDSKGNTRVWWMETGYNDAEQWAWRSHSGIHGGQIVTSEWKFVEQKNVGRANETSLEQQATAEAVAELNKKLERGYFKHIAEVDSFEKVKPMLASKFEDAKLDFDNELYYSQPKLDGIRCIARADGLWSRSGKEHVAVPHISEELKVFFDQYPDAILDGELYNHELKDDFNTITSLVRKTKPTKEDIAETAKLVQYHVYDVIRMPHDDKFNFINRWQWFYDQGFGNGAVRVVETLRVCNQEQIDRNYSDYLQDGYEGQMIRKNEVYEENKRSKYLIKRKEFLDAEFKVISMEEGKGNWAGYIKRFVLDLGDGREFGSGVRGNQEVLKALFESGKTPDWVTCRYFTPTPDGIPRFPVVTDWGYGKRDD